MTKPIFWCELCGTELEPGSFCYCIDGQRICPSCLGAFAAAYFRDALEVVE